MQLWCVHLGTWSYSIFTLGEVKLLKIKSRVPKCFSRNRVRPGVRVFRLDARVCTMYADIKTNDTKCRRMRQNGNLMKYRHSKWGRCSFSSLIYFGCIIYNWKLGGRSLESKGCWLLIVVFCSGKLIQEIFLEKLDTWMSKECVFSSSS